MILVWSSSWSKWVYGHSLPLEKNNKNRGFLVLDQGGIKRYALAQNQKFNKTCLGFAKNNPPKKTKRSVDGAEFFTFVVQFKAKKEHQYIDLKSACTCFDFSLYLAFAAFEKFSS